MAVVLTKLLLLLAVVFGAIWWLRQSGRQRRPPTTKPQSPSAPVTPVPPPAMLACAHCGLHLPQPDALFDAGGHPYCSAAHRLSGPTA
jgi:uncharacterized protein